MGRNEGGGLGHWEADDRKGSSTMNKLSGSYELTPVVLPQYRFRLRSVDFNRSGGDFTIWFLEGILEKNPNYVDCLMYLGNAYTNRGRYEDGLKVDLKLAELKPDDPIIRYNLGCSYSLVCDLDAAVEALEVAITLGYKDIKHLENDRDLDKLRGDERYRGLLDKIKGKGKTKKDGQNK